MTNSNDKQKISGDEAQIYDRQIRLWGLEAQNRFGVSINCSNIYNLKVKASQFVSIDHRIEWLRCRGSQELDVVGA
jgi:hypothetical protein